MRKNSVWNKLQERCYSIWAWFHSRKYEKEIAKIEEEMQVVWGIKSYDDLSSGTEANLHTMNDIDITYLKKEDKYTIGIETIYFLGGDSGAKKYLQNLLDKFTQFMIAKGYNTELKPNVYDLFTSGLNINHHFDSIEELYATFKFLVEGFIRQSKD